MITVFKNFSDTTNPKYFDIDTVLEQIKSCKIQKQIDAIRNESDKKIKTELKKNLPCILFAGKFTKRNDKSITEHSGFVVLDWDKLENVEEKKNELKKHSFIYSLFVSPSGDGLKGVVRIPKEIENHRGYYRGLMALFPELDATSINESRICYASCDSEIYINKDATVFTNLIEEKQIEKPIQKDFTKEKSDSKIDIALNLIRNAVDGEKHIQLLKASRLMGGFIQGGLISESLAVSLLEQEISNKGVESLKDAQVTISKGIEHGKNSPIEIELKQNYVSKVQSSISVNDENFDFLADKEEINEYLNQWRNGTFERGLTTGLPSLDKYFLFKRGNFNVVNGFDNVGKSTALWYLTLLSSMFHGWRWILCSNENRNGAVVKRLIEFYHGVSIDKQSEEQFNEGLRFVNEHFTIISNKNLLNFKDVLNITEKLLSHKKYDGVLIDPYNSLKIDLSNASKLSTHEYHYEAASEMQIFAKTFDICVYLNCHVITGAMRLQRGETKHKAPSKADTEGGGKFSNKADDFMTFHRDVQDKENYTKMQIHVRKIKEVETGGGYTPYEEPYILEMQRGMCRYADESGFDPIHDYWLKHNRVVLKDFIEQQQPLQPSNDFETEVDNLYNDKDFPNQLDKDEF
jgi:hypothetical protein